MKRLIIATFVALAMTVFVNAHSAFSQEEAESGTSVDANWSTTASTIDAPVIDESAASADKVLEIPQAACNSDGATGPCDDTTASADNDDPNDQTINAPQPGAPPQVFDDDTASSGGSDQDWGNADEYQNQQVYAAVPYAVYPYPYSVNTQQTTNRPSPVPASAYAPMSSPITQAALPPLNQGPWMNPPTMSAFARPAGSPMMGLSMSHSFGFHH
jgi:hypothetical protein